MSIEMQAHLICDKCGIRLNDIFETAATARRYARHNGWVRIWEGHGLGSGYKDYCPDHQLGDQNDLLQNIVQEV